MKKLSASLMEVYFSGLCREGITGCCAFRVQGQALQPGHRAVPGITAEGLRFALQESIEEGGVYLRRAGAGLHWVFALEHLHVVHGGLCGRVQDGVDAALVRAEGERAFALFYDLSEWTPALLRERRQDQLRRRQLAEAARQRESASSAGDTPVDQERMLLAYIRAGDRNGARRLLNEMLARIYLSVPQTVVLRARVIELVCSLTRAAVEDNPLLGSLIEQNQRWTERMVHAESFEVLSTLLMEALDAFFDAVHLHGSNRTNVHVHKALTFISENFAEPLSLQQVARHTGLSVYRLAHLFREHTGKTVVATIRQVRLQRAELLLRQTGMTCAEVGYAVGFTDQSYFSLHFRHQTGQSPGQYRRARV